MNAFLQMDGPPRANLNLGLQTMMMVALLIGAWLARRRWYGWHRAVQTSVVLLNLVLIAAIMAPSFVDQGVLARTIAHPGRSYFTMALAHAVVGTLAAALGAYVVLSAGTPLLPEALRIKNLKRWMRSTLLLWLIAFGLGVATYAVWYGAAAAPAASATPPAAAPATGKVVELSDYKFTPESLTIDAGTIVAWVDKVGLHSVSCDEEKFESPPLAVGERFEHRFDHAGTYKVYCGLHGAASMSSTVRVTAPPAR
jgi:plastocyanin